MAQTKAQLVDISTTGISAGSASAPGITFTGDTNTGIYSPGADQVAISTGGSGRLFVDSSGNININNSSQIGVARFGIKANAATENAIAIQTSTDGILAVLRGLNAAGTEVASIHYDTANSAIIARTGNAEKLRIDSSGRLGVGSSSPVATNHIRGSGTSGQVTASWMLENASSGTAGMDITGAAGSSIWRFLYGGGPSTGTNTLTPALTIGVEGSAAGRVGIGTTSPLQALHVYNGSNTIAAYLESTANVYLALKNTSQTAFVGATGTNLTFENNGSERARIDSSGRLLVGTSTGSALTVINGSLAVGSTCVFTKSSGASPLVFTVTWGQSGQAAGMFTLRAAHSNYSGAYGGSGEWVYRFIGAATSNVAALRSSTDGTAPTVTVTNVSGTSFTVSVAFSFQQCFADISVMGATNIS